MLLSRGDVVGAPLPHAVAVLSQTLRHADTASQLPWKQVDMRVLQRRETKESRAKTQCDARITK